MQHKHIKTKHKTNKQKAGHTKPRYTVRDLSVPAADARQMYRTCVGGFAEGTRLIAASRTRCGVLFENTCCKSRCANGNRTALLTGQ